MIRGARVREARELLGWKQGELANAVGVSQAAIAYFENDQREPSEEILQRIALQTGFPISFFRADLPDDFPAGSLSFRARESMTSIQRLHAHRYGHMMFRLADSLARQVRPVPVTVPTLTGDPEAAAQQVRAVMGVATNEPISHLIRRVERLGVIVLAMPAPMAGGDAYATWTTGKPSRPVIVLGRTEAGDRQRLTVAHELHHLVHGDRRRSAAEAEWAAYGFAAELLLPQAALRREVTTPVSLPSLAALKPRWKVSMQALARRIRDLGIITDRQYRYLMQQISARGWRLHEPDNLAIATEKPRALRQMAEMLYGDPVDYARLARDALLPQGFVRDVLQEQTGTPARSTRTRSGAEGKLIDMSRREQEDDG